MAQPMFEPSDNWKQTHGLPAEALEGDARDWSHDRFSPMRDMREHSPERFSVRDYPPHYVPPPPNDRFRRFSGPPGPPEQRDPLPFNPRTDSYRPQYEERGPWGAPPYHAPGAEGRQRPPRDARFAPRTDFGDRMRFSRERSVGGGSVHTSPLPSPIRTRTNLPERGPFSAHSRSASGSYLQSPTHKAQVRWDYEGPLQAKGEPTEDRSRSVSQEAAYQQARRGDSAGEANGWGGRSVRQQSPDPYVPAGYAHRTLSGSPPRDDQSPPRYFSSTPPHRADDYAQAQQPDAYDVQPVSIFGAGTNGTGRQDKPSQAGAQYQNRLTLEQDDEGQPSLPTENPNTYASTTATVAVTVAETSTKMSVDDEDMEAVERSLFVSTSHTAPSRGDSSSPEPDIPLSALAKHSTTARSSLSLPMTPIPQSEPPSRGEPAHVGKSLAPNIQPAAGQLMPLQDVLRAVVMLRLQHDRQTQEERVTPVLLDNLSRVEPPPMPSVTAPSDVIREVTAELQKKGQDHVHDETRQSLQVRFAQRSADLTGKVARLKDEYLGLHKQWLVHCSKLDDAAKAQALQEAAATAGRTTRRSLATMGDAVRSDLEMEQIIASLGNEEMTDANHLGAKNAAVIPDMLSVTRGEIEHVFDDTNNAVEDPAAYYAPTTGIDDWTEDEVTLFLDKFAEFPKQFGIIADFLPHKTPAQCVTFYYLHKNKHIDFRKVVARRATKRKRGGRKQKSNALLTDIRKRDEEASANGTARRRRAPPATTSAEPRRRPGRPSVATIQEEPATGTPTPEPENEPRKRRRRAPPRVVATEQEEAAAIEEAEPDPKPKRVRKPRRPPATTSASASATPAATTPLDTPVIPDGPESNPMEDVVPTSTQASSSRRSGSSSWSEEDRGLFLHLLSQHGDDFKRIAASMPNKTTVQVGAFYRANADSMGLDIIVANAPKRSTSPDQQPRGVWKQVTFTGARQYQDARAPVEAYQQSVPPSASSSGASTPIPGFSAPPPPLQMQMQYRPSSYETMGVQYAFNRRADERSGNGGTGAGAPGGTLLELASPSPFAQGPLTTRFSSFPYRNFSPSHFTDNATPSFSGVQSTYDAQVQGRGGARGEAGGAPAAHAPPHAAVAWAHAPLQTTDDLVAYLAHRTLARQP
ncbi:hypothetical protein PsYK624_012190 [Phanerochaete sordida]|uniref:SANT domain-containing protein n=1 Tax=Phanerochaete sordida TaxID=48140 RepID=A0A9P3FYY8_9APHY|nr:hypothetical protein PsYK624_012190 [Phanerochaete sordida]